MAFELLDLKPRNPYLSLAMDEAIASYFGRQSNHPFHGAIRLWSNPSSIILGRTCAVEKNLDARFLEAPRFRFRRGSSEPVLCRRASGGGTVLHGPGNLNYSFFLNLDEYPGLYDVHNSYRFFIGLIQKALIAQEIQTEMKGFSDLVINGADGGKRKISGNSQFRKYGVLVHHGTLIMRKNLIESINAYLAHPPKEPDYRNGRPHGEFLGSLPDTFDLTAFYQILSSEFGRFLGVDDFRTTDRQESYVIFQRARRLAKRIYANPDWILNGTAVRASEATR